MNPAELRLLDCKQTEWIGVAEVRLLGERKLREIIERARGLAAAETLFIERNACL
jgi:hypothetical protein